MNVGGNWTRPILAGRAPTPGGDSGKGEYGGVGAAAAGEVRVIVARGEVSCFWCW